MLFRLSVLSALNIYTGVNTIEEFAIDVSLRSTNSFDTKLFTQVFIIGLPHITNILLANTVINHGCQWNSEIIIFF